MKILINIPDEVREDIIYKGSISIFARDIVANAIAHGTVINTDKFVAVEDIVKRYMLHAQVKADQEISQIIYEVKKYTEEEIKGKQNEM